MLPLLRTQRGILHHCQLCGILTIINSHQRIFQRESDRMRERALWDVAKKFVLNESVGLARSFSARTGSEIPIDCGFILYLSALAKSPT